MYNRFEMIEVVERKQPNKQLKPNTNHTAHEKKHDNNKRNVSNVKNNQLYRALIKFLIRVVIIVFSVPPSTCKYQVVSLLLL